jgi:NADP-reducing hydrogenase subunit HndB
MSDRINSPEELLKLRDKVRGQVDLRGEPKPAQVVVHMGTCGIAAGARDVIAEMIAELDSSGVHDVTVRQSGCIGLCEHEPMLTYTDAKGRAFLYVHLTRDKVKQIVKRHIVAGQPVEQYIMEGDAK